MIRASVWCLCVFLCVCVSSFAATINVGSGGSIQNAINSANSGDIIIVAAGTYGGDLTLNKNNITVRANGVVKVAGFVRLPNSGCLIEGIQCGLSQIPNAKAWLQLSGDHNTARNCILDTVSNSNPVDDGIAFELQGNNNTVFGCIVRNFVDIDAFRIFGDSNTIDSCLTYNLTNPNYARGVHADNIQTWGGCSNALVQNCWFVPVNADSPHQFGIIDTNPGGSSSNCHDFTFRNNIIIGGEHFFLMIRNAHLYNNIWYQSAKSIGDLFFLNQGSYPGYEIKNNVFYTCGTSASNGFIQGGIQSGTQVSNNYFGWNNNTVSHDVGNSAINGGNPNWVNPGSSSVGTDFHTNTGSILQGAGVALSPAFVDRDGNVRSGKWDIGPYQAGGAPPTPPPVSTTFKIGDIVVTKDVVNVRDTAAGTLKGTQVSGSLATVQSASVPMTFGGSIVNWWNLKFQTDPSGWVGEDNLALAPKPTPTPTPSATPIPTPPPLPTPTATPSYSQWQQQLNDWINQNPPRPNP